MTFAYDNRPLKLMLIVNYFLFYVVYSPKLAMKVYEDYPCPCHCVGAFAFVG